MNFIRSFMEESREICQTIDYQAVEQMVNLLAQVRYAKGRVFLLGVGGSAGNASHAVNDFRKLCGIEAYAPTDNVSELTARINDDGFEGAFAGWLRASRLNENDCLFILSVGGGDRERNISVNLINAIDHAREVGAKVTGIVGRRQGYTAQNADVCCVIPTVNEAHVTPQSEAFQAVVWHAMVSHPELKVQKTKWESELTK